LAAKGNNIFIGPDDGAYLPALDITHKVTVENLSSGAFTTIEASLPPGAMIPPHTHTREDECNFVLEGELTLDVGGEIVIAPVGSFVVKLRRGVSRLVQHWHRACPVRGDSFAR
jgi:quercetin dioxygenase-like cupin family protein